MNTKKKSILWILLPPLVFVVLVGIIGNLLNQKFTEEAIRKNESFYSSGISYIHLTVFYFICVGISLLATKIEKKNS